MQWTVLPDRSLLIWRKLVRNAKIEKLIYDILGVSYVWQNQVTLQSSTIFRLPPSFLNWEKFVLELNWFWKFCYSLVSSLYWKANPLQASPWLVWKTSSTAESPSMKSSGAVLPQCRLTSSPSLMDVMPEK